MDRKTLKHLDLFSGYGGFTIPASKYGIETINFSEIDKYATAVLKYRFPDIKNLGDITKIKGEDLPDVDIITGGSPCQDLSVAGKGAGLDGGRSGLFFCFINLIKEKQPMYFVWENVKGAFSSSKGWDFARVQIEMEQAGYDVFWQLINAKDFGVPQNRERIFAIGIRKGSGREILFEQRESGKNINELTQGVSDAQRVYDTTLAKSQKALGGGQGAKTGLYAVTARKHRTKFDTSDTVSTLTPHYRGSPDGDGRSAVVIPVLTPDRENKRQNGRRFKENGDPSFTITGQDKHGIYNGTRIRRLTPTECERLMGLEDGWTAKGIIDGKEVDISDTQRYKLCGNGVVVNCVDYIYNLITKSYER